MALAAQTFLDNELPAADSAADRAQVLRDALAMLPSQFVGIRTALRPRLVVPFSAWEIAGTVDVDRTVELDLAGAALLQTDTSASTFRVLPPSWGTIIRNGTLLGPHVTRFVDDESGQPVPNPAAHAAPGIEVRSFKTTLADLIVRELGSGVFIESDVQAGQNANQWRIRNVLAYGCHGDGLRIEGGDTNGGASALFAADGCEGDGIHDRSFLGNYFEATHIHTCGGYAYRCPVGANRSVVAGGYIEADTGYNIGGVHQSVLTDSSNTLFAGGDFVFYARGGERVGASRSLLRFADGPYRVTMPHAGANCAMTVQRMNEAGQPVEGVNVLRWVDSLKRIHLAQCFTGTGYTGTSPVPNNGITAPYSMTSSAATEGLGEARVNAAAGTAFGLPIPEATP